MQRDQGWFILTLTPGVDEGDVADDIGTLIENGRSATSGSPA